MQLLTPLILILFLALLYSTNACLIANFTWDKGPDIWRGSLIDNGVTTCTLSVNEAFMQNNLAYMQCNRGHYAYLEWIGEQRWDVSYAVWGNPGWTLFRFGLREEGNKGWRRMWARAYGC